MRYFIELAYDGTNYHGWQIQPNGISVQQVVEQCLSHLLGCPIGVVGAGRTDTGVHARCMYAHFDTPRKIDPSALCNRLDAFLPGDIRAVRIAEVCADAHARFSALSRKYEYHLCLGKDPFARQGKWQIYKGSLDVEAMNRGAAILCRESDFECFSKVKTDVKTFTCRIDEARWEDRGGGDLVFHIRADRFLRNMVRAIVGTLVRMGQGKLDEEGLWKILKSRDRSQAGMSVPACGLYLVDVRYPDGIWKADRDTKGEISDERTDLRA